MDVESELEALRARCTRLERAVAGVLELQAAAGFPAELLEDGAKREACGDVVVLGRG